MSAWIPATRPSAAWLHENGKLKDADLDRARRLAGRATPPH
ncbi:MAG: hypothetical protein U5L11_00500 [Arhodomonas sp.]|nr:hypothetical protein [Arhodomonas sp.]